MSTLLLSSIRDKLQQKRMSVQNRRYDKSVHCVLIGESSVGKTSLVKRFTEGAYKICQCTIGVDSAVKYVMLGDQTVKLEVSVDWSTIK